MAVMRTITPAANGCAVVKANSYVFVWNANGNVKVSGVLAAGTRNPTSRRNPAASAALAAVSTTVELVYPYRKPQAGLSPRVR